MKQRVYWIDNLKAFTIFTVVLGHLLSCPAFKSDVGQWAYDNIIIPFHMPVFAVLSGWFFSAKEDFLHFLKKKTVGILLPYIVWGFIWFFCCPIVMQIAEGNSLHLSSIVWQMKLLLHGGYCLYGWWFLRALFFCMMMAFLSVKICRGKMLWAGMGSCVLLYLIMWTGIVPNMSMKDSLLKGFFYLYPFFWTGFALRKSEQWLERQSHWLLPFSICTFITMLFFWKDYDSFYAMNTSVMEPSGASGIVGWQVVWKTIWRYLVGVAGSLSLVLLFKRFTSNKGVEWVLHIGQETLGIYILQSLVYWSLPSVPLFPTWGNWGNFAFSLVISAVVVWVACQIIRFSSRNRYLGLILWGKRLS
jgi:fucose 4-O-acetylase-like acetyltransferase